ncbi:MAG: MarR family winged helix-turn-helix transcriptional regulator [Rectinemataceae bacterium]
MVSIDASGNNDGLVREIVDLFHEMGKLRRKATTSAWMDLHLTLPQFKMLVVVSQSEPSAVGGIAEQLCIGEPTASYLVDRLVQAELVERAEDPADRRRAMIRLSVEGRILLDKLIGPRNWLDDQLRNLDGEDLAALRRGIGAVVAMLESQDGKSNGGEACLT